MKNLRLKGYEKKIKIWLYFFLNCRFKNKIDI